MLKFGVPAALVLLSAGVAPAQKPNAADELHAKLKATLDEKYRGKVQVFKEKYGRDKFAVTLPYTTLDKKAFDWTVTFEVIDKHPAPRVRVEFVCQLILGDVHASRLVALLERSGDGFGHSFFAVRPAGEARSLSLVSDMHGNDASAAGVEHEVSVVFFQAGQTRDLWSGKLSDPLPAAPPAKAPDKGEPPAKGEPAAKGKPAAAEVTLEALGGSWSGPMLIDGKEAGNFSLQVEAGGAATVARLDTRGAKPTFQSVGGRVQVVKGHHLLFTSQDAKAAEFFDVALDAGKLTLTATDGKATVKCELSRQK